MKKLKQASREQLSQEYYQLAASAGDTQREIRRLRLELNNTLSSMSVVMKRLQAMPAAVAPDAPEEGGNGPAIDGAPRGGTEGTP